MARRRNGADEFIESIEALAEDAERTSQWAAKEATADHVHPNDARAFGGESDEIAFIGRELRALADRLNSIIVFGNAREVQS